MTLQTLNEIRRIAQRDADRDGKPVAILDFNRHFGHLYVCRNVKPGIEALPEFVELVEPNPGKPLGNSHSPR